MKGKQELSIEEAVNIVKGQLDVANQKARNIEESTMVFQSWQMVVRGVSEGLQAQAKIEELEARIDELTALVATKGNRKKPPVKN